MVTLIQYQVYMLAGTAGQLSFDPVKSQVYQSFNGESKQRPSNDVRWPYINARFSARHRGELHATYKVQIADY